VRTLVVGAREVERYRGEVARAVDDVRRLQQQGWRLVMATEGHGPAQRMVEQLRAAEVPARLVGGVDGEPEGGVVLVTPAPVGPGFVHEALHLAVFSEADLTGRPGSSTRDMRRMPSKRR